MADKDKPEVLKSSESEVVAPKKSTKKAPVKKTAKKKSVAGKSTDQVTVQDMHELLTILREGLESRDKTVDYLQQQIALNQEQIEQNKKILNKRGLAYKLSFALLAIGVLVVGFDQHTIIKSFDTDMTKVAVDMDKMLLEMTAMRIAMESMSKDFSLVSRDVSSIDKSVTSMSHGVKGMSRDTHEMNRSMDTMTVPWTPWK